MVLVTGAAGRIGRVLAEDLAGELELRLTDRVAPGPGDPPALAGLRQADITDAAALDALMAGVDAVVHLAGSADVRAGWETVRTANLDGTAQVLAAAVRAGVPRVVLASSNRVVEAASPLKVPPTPGGGYRRHPDEPVAPDSLYGVSKAFGEALAAYHSAVHGLPTVCLRLGSVDVGREPRVADKPRAWALWLSRRDLVGLVRAALTVPLEGHATVFACSANTRRWWDLGPTAQTLGYHPVDDSERLLHDGHAAAAVPPAPVYPLEWGAALDGIRPDQGTAHLVHLGQSGFWLRTPGARLVLDLFLTEYPDRLQPPLLDPADVPVDLVLVSHTHRDHLDLPALASLAAAQPGARFAGPPTVVEKLVATGIGRDRVDVLLPGDRLACGDVEVEAVAVTHRPTTPDAQGYLLDTPAGRILHTGDAEYDQRLSGLAPRHPDLLLVPINGRKGNMTAEQAAALAADLAVPAVIPMHYGCLQPVEDLPDRFLAELARVAPEALSALVGPGSIARLPLRPPPAP